MCRAGCGSKNEIFTIKIKNGFNFELKIKLQAITETKRLSERNKLINKHLKIN